MHGTIRGMGQDILIRRATPDDIVALVPLIHHVLRVSNTPDYGVDNVERVVGHFSAEGVRAMIARTHSLVAEDGGVIVGTASLGPGSADTTQALRTFFVNPDLQRRGIGRALLAALEARAHALGLHVLPVRSSIAGVPFYAAHGFIADQDIWDGDERTVQMHKPLA